MLNLHSLWTWIRTQDSDNDTMWMTLALRIPPPSKSQFSLPQVFQTKAEVQTDASHEIPWWPLDLFLTEFCYLLTFYELNFYFTHFLFQIWVSTSPSKWLLKYCLQYVRAFLTQSSQPFNSTNSKCLRTRKPFFFFFLQSNGSTSRTNFLC